MTPVVGPQPARHVIPRVPASASALVFEECGLRVTGGRLACVDFRRPKPDRPGGVRFLFDCGVL